MVELKFKQTEYGAGYYIVCDGKQAGIIEYKPFWNGMPYLSLIKILPEYQKRGVGTEAMRLFEQEVKREGNKALLVSTQADEEAQHFYRKIGYRECGCLILNGTPFQQAMEMFFIKNL